MSQASKLKVAHLCCGIGGTAVGFEQAGFSTVYANDCYPLVSETFELNLGIKVDVNDVARINLEDLPHFDVLTASMPIIGLNTKNNPDVLKHPVSEGIYRVIEAKKPSVFCLETLATTPEGNQKQLAKIDWLIQDLKDLGYHIQTQVVSEAIEGGLPTTRKCILIFGFLNEEQWNQFKGVMPSSTVKTLGECLDIKTPTPFEATSHNPAYNLAYFSPNPRVQEILQSTPIETGLYKRPIKNNSTEKTTDEFVTVDLENERIALGTIHHNPCYYVVREDKNVRVITIEEALALKGFDVNYQLATKADQRVKTVYAQYHQMMSQIEFSMSVPLAKQIGLAIKESFKQEA